MAGVTRQHRQWALRTSGEPSTAPNLGAARRPAPSVIEASAGYLEQRSPYGALELNRAIEPTPPGALKRER
jgi:hypothetical protein